MRDEIKQALSSEDRLLEDKYQQRLEAVNPNKQKGLEHAAKSLKGAISGAGKLANLYNQDKAIGILSKKRKEFDNKSLDVIGKTPAEQEKALKELSKLADGLGSELEFLDSGVKSKLVSEFKQEIHGKITSLTRGARRQGVREKQLIEAEQKRLEDTFNQSQASRALIEQQEKVRKDLADLQQMTPGEKVNRLRDIEQENRNWESKEFEGLDKAQAQMMKNRYLDWLNRKLGDSTRIAVAGQIRQNKEEQEDALEKLENTIAVNGPDAAFDAKKETRLRLSAYNNTEEKLMIYKNSEKGTVARGLMTYFTTNGEWQNAEYTLNGSLDVLTPKEVARFKAMINSTRVVQESLTPFTQSLSNAAETGNYASLLEVARKSGNEQAAKLATQLATRENSNPGKPFSRKQTNKILSSIDQSTKHGGMLYSKTEKFIRDRNERITTDPIGSREQVEPGYIENTTDAEKMRDYGVFLTQTQATSLGREIMGSVDDKAKFAAWMLHLQNKHGPFASLAVDTALNAYRQMNPKEESKINIVQALLGNPGLLGEGFTVPEVMNTLTENGAGPTRVGKDYVAESLQDIQGNLYMEDTIRHIIRIVAHANANKNFGGIFSRSSHDDDVANQEEERLKFEEEEVRRLSDHVADKLENSGSNSAGFDGEKIFFNPAAAAGFPDGEENHNDFMTSVNTRNLRSKMYLFDAEGQKAVLGDQKAWLKPAFGGYQLHIGLHKVHALNGAPFIISESKIYEKGEGAWVFNKENARFVDRKDLVEKGSMAGKMVNVAHNQNFDKVFAIRPEDKDKKDLLQYMWAEQMLKDSKFNPNHKDGLMKGGTEGFLKKWDSAKDSIKKLPSNYRREATVEHLATYSQLPEAEQTPENMMKIIDGVHIGFMNDLVNGGEDTEALLIFSAAYGIDIGKMKESLKQKVFK